MTSSAAPYYISLSRHTVGRIAVAVLVYAALLVAWYLLTIEQTPAARLRFPSPGDVAGAAHQLIFRGYGGAVLSEHILATIIRVVLGFVIAGAVGVAVGMAMGLSRRFELVVNPVVQMLRPIPPLAWIPMAILWFGLDSTSKIFVAFLAVFTPAVINTYTGVRDADRTLIQAARVHGAAPADVVRSVILQGALPMIFTGLRLSLQVSWMAVVASELVGSYRGLGYIMILAARDLASSIIVVAMICIAILGFISTLLLTLIERRVIRWR